MMDSLSVTDAGWRFQQTRWKTPSSLGEERIEGDSNVSADAEERDGY